MKIIQIVWNGPGQLLGLADDGLVYYKIEDVKTKKVRWHSSMDRVRLGNLKIIQLLTKENSPVLGLSSNGEVFSLVDNIWTKMIKKRPRRVFFIAHR